MLKKLLLKRRIKANAHDLELMQERLSQVQAAIEYHTRQGEALRRDLAEMERHVRVWKAGTV